MLKRLLLLGDVPLRLDFGRLFLRIAVFLPLFLKHGFEKVFMFGPTLQHFSDPHRVIDPLHIGPLATLIIAMLGDGVCSLLIMIGLGTRLAALYTFCNLFVAWATVHHFALVTHSDETGETLFIYMATALTLFLVGPGKFSLDALIAGAHGEKRATGGRESKASV